MNYATLKSMIDSLIKGYSCPSCSSNTITEQNVDVIGAAGNTINIDMKCPSCKKHYMARMEVVGLNLADSSQFSNGKIGDLKLNVDTIKKALSNIKEKQKIDVNNQNLPIDSIKDNEIVDLSKDLKNRKLKVEDLFSE